jgi:MoaA/NifB/PqqE/SkfB family radical SAM enzyme
MHLADKILAEKTSVDQRLATENEGRGLDFLWLELTNRCNLKCVHCYTESDAGSTERDLMTAHDYESVIDQAHNLGCRKIQFIGGEPQLSRDFPGLLAHANKIGFEFVEVFTNLTRLTEDILDFAAHNGVHFATSVYSHDPEVHDAITTVRSSHARTVSNLRRLIDSGVSTRAAIVKIQQSESEIDRTKQFLQDLGVGSVRESQVRGFGRGEELTGQHADMSELCGHCWDGKLCIAPDGTTYPCVMARQWPVGDIFTDSLERIVNGIRLIETRKAIFEAAWRPKLTQPTNWCHPCSQSCNPDITSCNPSEGVCNPFSCPQSCHPGLPQ